MRALSRSASPVTGESVAAGLEARGVRFEQAPHRVAELPHADLWIGFFRDMDGNLLAIMSEVPKA